jgi:aminoglycoside 3-N-acetyltransferase I
VIAAAIARSPEPDFDGFAERHPELLKKVLLRAHYSRERMLTPEAKVTFVEPDIVPLPVIGLGGGSVLEVRHLTPNDVSLMEALLKILHEAFDDGDAYTANRPSQGYLRRLLGRDSFIALAALKGGDVVGGIAAYELHKFEQERSEIYLYDLAVSGQHRREGIATALIEKLKSVAAGRGAYLVFVQAEMDNEPAVALYTKLGRREDVLHFDIAI